MSQCSNSLELCAEWLLHMSSPERSQARADARKAKDFAKADAIRDELTSPVPRCNPVLQLSMFKTVALASRLGVIPANT